MVISLIHNLDYSPTHHITRCMRYVPAVSTSTFVQMISISLVTKHTDAIKGDARCVREIVLLSQWWHSSASMEAQMRTCTRPSPTRPRIVEVVDR